MICCLDDGRAGGWRRSIVGLLERKRERERVGNIFFFFENTTTIYRIYKYDRSIEIYPNAKSI